MGKILIVADPEEGCVATSRGLELARRLDHDVEVVAFVYAPLDRLAEDKTEKAKMRQKLLDRRTAQVQERIDHFAKDGQKVVLKVVWLKTIYPWIVKRAATANFDLVIKTGARTGGMTHTSTDWHLLRDCAAPIFITAENKWSRTRPVLAAVDLDTRKRSKKQLNKKVIHHARALADSLGVELKIISAVVVPTLLADLDIVDPATYAKERKEEMMPQLKALATEFGLPQKAFVLKRGPVDKVIHSQAAKIRAQVVVMGTVARKGIKAQLVGNTAESVLQDLRTDVLALKPDS